ncbi:MAG: Ig-like domain-containing protein [Spirochaetales bacterium]
MLKLKKLYILILVFVSVFFVAACGEDTTTPTEQHIMVSSIVLNVDEVNLVIGNQFQLVTTVLPVNAEYRVVEYSVFDDRVATVSDTGKITAVAAGSTKVRVKSLDGSDKYEYVDVNVQATATQLTAPTNLAITDGVLTWDAVDDALSYYVNINGVDSYSVTLPQYTIATFNTQQTFKIKAMGDGRLAYTSAYSATITATLMSVPTGVQNNQDIISWTAVTGATSYDVYVNGQITNTIETSLQLDLSVAQVYSVKVRAVSNVSNAYPSAYSAVKTIERLATPNNFTYQQTGVSWSAVTHALSYSVKVNNNIRTSSTTSYKLSTSDPAGDYEFSVKATGNGTTLLDSVYTINLETTKLEVPQNLRIQDGYVYWDENTSATSYSLRINGNLIQVGSDQSYLLGEEYLAGVYSIAVVANGNGTTSMNSNESDAISATKLNAIQSFGVSNGVLTWVPVSGATRYIIKFNDTEYETSDTYFDDASILTTQEYAVSIRAEADGNIYSEYSSELTVQKLVTPTNLRVDAGMLRWSSVLGTSSYEVLIGGQSYNSGILNAYKVTATAGTYQIKLRSIGDNNRYLSSDYTDEITATKLETPATISLENGYVQLSTVANATEYVLNINGETVKLTTDDLPYHVNGNPGTTYLIKALAKGDSAEYLNSDFTSEISAYQLSDIENFRIENGILKWNSVQYVTAYEIWLAEGETDITLYDLSLSSNYDLSGLAYGDYTVKIQGRGDNAYNLATSESAILNFSKLSAPSAYRIYQGQVMWDRSPNALAYQLIIDDEISNVTENNFFVLPASYAAGIHTVKVYAVGDGTTYLDSEETIELSGEKLTAPTNLRVENGVLTWDAVDYADSYSVKIAGLYYHINSTLLLPAPEYDGGNYDIGVCAIAEDGFLSDTSTLINADKLSMPGDLRIENGIIRWNSVLNGTGYSLTINGTTLPDTTNVTYTLANFATYGAGVFEASIYALGDSVNKINSDKSNVLTIYVLNYPSNRRVEGGLIAWNSVYGAQSYELLITDSLDNETTINVGDVTNFILPDSYPSGDYNIRVKSIGNGAEYITSEYSSALLVTRLDAPTNLHVTNGIIYFNSATNATGYEVIANGSYVPTGISLSCELGTDFEYGDYELAVRSMGDDTIYVTSAASSTISATKLEPIANFRIENGVFKWTANNNASAYLLIVGANTINVGLTTSYALPDTYPSNSYYVSIKARGTSTYLTSSASNILSVYKMDPVTYFRVEDGILKWTRAAGAMGDVNGYTIYISNATVNFQATLPSGTSSYTIGNDFAADTYSIYLQTNGNSTYNLNSVKVGADASGSSPLVVTKLATPTNISLTKDETNQYYINWDAVANTQLYELNISGHNADGDSISIVETIDVTNASEYPYPINETITEGEYVVTVKALGTVLYESGSIYANSNSSAQFNLTRPTTPTNVQMANGKATWDASDFADSYELVIVLDNDIENPIIVTVTNNYYYLTELGTYSITVTAYCSGSLPSIASGTSAEAYLFNLFQSGNGSEEYPFVIINSTQLRNVRFNPTAHYSLEADITLNATVDFEPIGTLNEPFIGSFEGNEHYIYNMTIDGTNYTYSGMFGYVGSGAGVYDLYLENVNIDNVSTYVGAIAGYSQGTIQNVTVSGSITPELTESERLYAGGIVGWNDGGTIRFAYSSADVAPTNDQNTVYAGGIAGYNNGLINRSGSEAGVTVSGNYAGGIAGYNDGNITESYNKSAILARSIDADVSAPGYAGGIAGYNYNTDTKFTGTIMNSYNWGNVETTSDNAYAAYAGGIAGYNKYSSASLYGLINNCYSTGTIKTTLTGGAVGVAATYSGGVAGYNIAANGITYSYYLSGSAYVLANNMGGTNSFVELESYMISYNFVSLLNSYSGGTDLWVASGTYPILS